MYHAYIFSIGNHYTLLFYGLQALFSPFYFISYKFYESDTLNILL